MMNLGLGPGLGMVVIGMTYTDGKEGRDFVHHNVLELGTNFKTAKLCEYAVDQSMVRT